MNTDTEKSNREIPTESSLIARIRMHLETDGCEIAVGNSRIILQTTEHIYGFFELIDERYPHMAIKSPLDSNPYDATDSTVIVDRVESLAKDYLLEVSLPGLIDLNTSLELEKLDQEGIALRDDNHRHYQIANTGEVSTHLDPRIDVPISDIPESD